MNHLTIGVLHIKLTNTSRKNLIPIMIMTIIIPISYFVVSFLFLSGKTSPTITLREQDGKGRCRKI